MMLSQPARKAAAFLLALCVIQYAMLTYVKRKGLHQARVDDIRENLQAVSASAGMAYELQNGDDHEAYKFESPLVYFGQKEYEAAVEFDVVKKKYCVPYPVKKILTELKESEERQHLTVCTHDPRIDAFISGSLHKSKLWEPDTTELLATALEAHRKESIWSTRRTVFLDLGANIGVHSLCIAALGHTVWAVEPLDINQRLIYHSANISGLDPSHLHLVRNVVDLKRADGLEIGAMSGNIGGSRPSIQGDGAGSGVTESSILGKKQAVSSVLLSDVFDAIYHDERSQGLLSRREKVVVVMKMDIEGFECRALLGSPSVLTDSRFFVPYIIMEWTFAKEFPDTCPPSMLYDFTAALVNAGYHPFVETTRPGADRLRTWHLLDPARSRNWRGAANIIWKHRDADDIFGKINAEHVTRQTKMVVGDKGYVYE